MHRFFCLGTAILLVGCSSPLRHYRLELDPLPQGAKRSVSATMQVDGKAETIDASLPLVREWTATSLSGELISEGPGGVRMRLIAKPEKSIERELVREEQGPLGVRGSIIERSSEGVWAIRLELSPIRPPVAESVPAP